MELKLPLGRRSLRHGEKKSLFRTVNKSHWLKSRYQEMKSEMQAQTGFSPINMSKKAFWLAKKKGGEIDFCCCCCCCSCSVNACLSSRERETSSVSNSAERPDSLPCAISVISNDWMMIRIPHFHVISPGCVVSISSTSGIMRPPPSSGFMSI